MPGDMIFWIITLVCRRKNHLGSFVVMIFDQVAKLWESAGGSAKRFSTRFHDGMNGTHARELVSGHRGKPTDSVAGSTEQKSC